MSDADVEVDLSAGWSLDSLVAPLSDAEIPAAPEADDHWELLDAEGAHIGDAWVYCASDKRLVEPVILSDGFQSGPTDLDLMYYGIETGAEYKLVTELHARGKDLIILGYQERSASILENVKAAIRCIELAIEHREGDAPLCVGGFSMGGLVTRYALAKIEADGDLPSHETKTYFSYDSPHRGAWIPISLQAFAHFFADTAPGPSAQINSPAAQELLLHHIATFDQDPISSPSDARATFLAELERVGNFPSADGLIRVGVANGPADGASNGVPAGDPALTYTAVPGLIYPARLWTQATTPAQIVAQLWSGKLGQPVHKVTTTGMLEFDGAPGGMLASFKIAADALNKAEGLPGDTVAHHDAICFIPVGSAVATRDIVDHASLYDPIGDDEASDLHHYKCAGQSEDHSLMTTELGGWLIDYF